MSNYKVYLDGVLLSNNPTGISDFELSIIRESAFNGQDNILRESTQTRLTFWGDGYRILCNKKKENRCANVSILIDYDCGNGNYEQLFKGIIPISKVEFALKRCLAKTNIRDNSFTGLIKDYLKTEIALFNTFTKNCQPISLPDKQILFLFFPSYFNATCFDALDAMKYLIAWITDNRVNVVSTTLTDNPIGFTLGFNLHNTAGSLDNTYPKLTFNTLFTEIRKKRRIYMGIEYNQFNIPYLRVENELTYFFQNTKVIEITDIPFDCIEKFDTQRLFNSIEVGSDKTELITDTSGFIDEYVPNNYIPTDSSLGWDKRVYNSCGECTVEANSEQNKLDLVSNWIIDSDKIREALSALPTTDTVKYNNDADIFMFEYADVAGVPTATLTTVGSVDIFNAGFRNQTVIENWLNYSPQCLSFARYSPFGFKAEQSVSKTIFIGGGCYDNPQNFTGKILYDTGNSLSLESFTNPSPCFGYGSTLNTTVFNCTQFGQYAFRGGIANIVQPSGTIPYAVDYTLSIVVYADNTLTTEIARTDTIIHVDDSKADPVAITVDTGLIGLAIGNVVLLYFHIETTVTNVIEDTDFKITSMTFEMYQDGFTCQNVEDILQDSKPNVIEFTSLLCYKDLVELRNKKRGYVLVSGRKYWISEIIWKEQEASKFTLIGNDTLCGC